METVKTLRGFLIETIVNHITSNNLFEFTVNFKELLQEKLNMNLNFETNVSDLVEKNEFLTFQISFKDENGVTRVSDITISRLISISKDHSFN